LEVKFPDVTEDHIFELARNMRPDDLEECRQAGYATALEAVSESVKASKECRACTVDDQVLAIYGVIEQSILTGSGQLWLLTTNLVESHKKTFVLYSKLVLLLMKQRWRSLVVPIGAEHKGALRLAHRYGFLRGQKYPDVSTGKPFMIHTIGG
jgi:hypothetical protein